MRGFVPARRAPLVSAKGAKAMFARARPSGSLCHGTKLYGSETRGVYPEPCRRTQTALAEKSILDGGEVAPEDFLWCCQAPLILGIRAKVLPRHVG
jgi:hypothetical protein